MENGLNIKISPVTLNPADEELLNHYDNQDPKSEGTERAALSRV